LTAPRSPHVTTSHAGPITPACPVDCLGTVLSRVAFNQLARGYDAPFEPPRTVGDVIELHQQRRLGEIGGLGPRRIGEIEASLVFAGLVVGNHNRQ
jgi:hypothetical protein